MSRGKLPQKVGINICFVPHRDTKALEKEGESLEPKSMAKAMSPAMLQVIPAALTKVTHSPPAVPTSIEETHSRYFPGCIDCQAPDCQNLPAAGYSSCGMCWVDGYFLRSDHDQQIHHVYGWLRLSHGPQLPWDALLFCGILLGMQGANCVTAALSDKF